MGLPGRTSLARILLLALALTCLPVAAAHAEPAAAAPQKGEAARPAARRTAFAPGRVLVGFEAGAIGGWTISSFVTSGATAVAERAGPGARRLGRRRRQPRRPHPPRPLHRAGRPGPAARLPDGPRHPAAADRRRHRRPQPVRAPAPRRRPRHHHHLRHDLLRAGPAAGGRLPLRQHQGGPGGGRRPAGGRPPAGRLEREDVVGRVLRGRFSYAIEATDAAGNTSRSRRHSVRVL
jgi:hypothetical protein